MLFFSSFIFTVYLASLSLELLLVLLAPPSPQLEQRLVPHPVHHGQETIAPERPATQQGTRTSATSMMMMMMMMMMMDAGFGPTGHSLVRHGVGLVWPAQGLEHGRQAQGTELSPQVVERAPQAGTEAFSGIGRGAVGAPVQRLALLQMGQPALDLWAGIQSLCQPVTWTQYI
jgi:hypothetical protein